MADEVVKKIKTKKVQVEDEKLAKVRSSNQKLSQIINELGQAHIRRKELEDELNGLEDNVNNLEKDFKATNQGLREALSELEKEFPKGNLDLQTGILTINEEIE